MKAVNDGNPSPGLFNKFSEDLIVSPDYSYGQQQMEEVCRHLYENEFQFNSRTGILSRILLRKAIGHIENDERKKTYWALMYNSPGDNARVKEFADNDNPNQIILDLAGMGKSYIRSAAVIAEINSEIEKLDGEYDFMTEENPREFLQPRKRFLGHVANDHRHGFFVEMLVQRIKRFITKNYT